MGRELRGISEANEQYISRFGEFEEIAKKYDDAVWLGAVLIKLNTIIGPQYLLEDRSADSELNGTIALFGGTGEKDETFRQTAIREIKEETGIELKDTDLTFIGQILSDSEGRRLVTVSFLAEWPVWWWSEKNKTRPSIGKVRRHQKEMRQNGKGGDFGPPMLLRRHGFWWIFHWEKFTPAAIHALFTELNRR